MRHYRTLEADEHPGQDSLRTGRRESHTYDDRCYDQCDPDRRWRGEEVQSIEGRAHREEGKCAAEADQEPGGEENECDQLTKGHCWKTSVRWWGAGDGGGVRPHGPRGCD